MTAGDWIREAHDRGYADPPALPSIDVPIDPKPRNEVLESPEDMLKRALARALETDLLERAACLEALMRFHGPEDAVGEMTAHGGDLIRDYWAGLRPADRHLYRRRAAAIILEYIGRKAEA